MNLNGFKAIAFTVFAMLLPNLSAWAKGADRIIEQRWRELKPFSSREEMLKQLGQRMPGVQFLSDSRLEAMAREDLKVLDQKYRELFPKLMANKSFPDFVIIQEADFVDVTSVSIQNSVNGAIAIPSSLFAPTVSRETRLGFLAHELAHIYLAHNHINFYPLSISNPELMPVLEEYLYYAGTAGVFPYKELAGLPWNGALSDSYLTYINDLESEGRRQSNPCGEKVTTSVHDFAVTTQTLFDNLKWDLNPTKEQQIQIKSTANDIKVRALECSKRLAFKAYSFREQEFLSQNLLAISSESLIQFYLQKDFKWEDQNELEILLKLSDFFHEQMRKLAEQHQLDKITWKSFEDEADEFAIVVLRSLKMDYSVSIAQVLNKVAGKDILNKCYESIRKKQPVSFGFIANPHHSLCYRIKRAKDLAADPNFTVTP